MDDATRAQHEQVAEMRRKLDKLEAQADRLSEMVEELRMRGIL
jgi:hypothetical protein